MDEPGKPTKEKRQIRRPHLVVFMISRNRRQSTDYLALVAGEPLVRGDTDS